MFTDRTIRFLRALAGIFGFALMAVAASESLAAIPQAERAALLNFYNATRGDDWLDHAGWLGAPGTECSWKGVACDQDAHVVSLDLSGNGLAGQISDLNVLTELRTLKLSANNLVGSIPNLSALSKLTTLNVRANHLSGAFPVLNASAPLETLNLGINELSGPVPALAGSATLAHAILDNNRFSGSLPDVAAFSHLIEVYADGNNFSGGLPTLPAGGTLQHFSASANDLSGPVPALGSMGALDTVDVSGNMLNALPPDYPASLKHFNASNNALAGSMPSLASSSLIDYRVDGNPQLSGRVAAGPGANTLVAGQSMLCPSGLQPANDPAVNAVWDGATGVTPWHHAFACDQQAPTPVPLRSTMEFMAPNLVAGTASQMRITISNPNAQTATGLAFGDAYPAGFRNADASVVVQNSCGGTVTATPGGTSMNLAGGSLAGKSTCTVSLNVKAASPGVWTNSTSPIQSGSPPTPSPAAEGSLIVLASNHAPVVEDEQATVARFGTTQAIVGNPHLPASVLENDTDSDAGDFVARATPAALPSYGTLQLNSDGTFTYQNSGGGLTDSFQYYACDTFTACTIGTVRITITDPNGTPQSIAFTSIPPTAAHVGDPVYQATAAATSGLPVILTIDASSATTCTINGSTVTFIAAGSCTIDANQSGDATFAPASQVQQTFSVAPASGAAPQTIAFLTAPPADARVGGPDYAVSATASSGLPVVLTIDGASATVCAIHAGAITFIGGGTCTVDANQGGNAQYAPASQEQQSFAVDAASGATPQTISFTSPAPSSASVGGSAYFVAAEATSGLPVVLTIDATSSSVCSISGSAVSFIGAGTCTIDANQGGSNDYAPAPQVQQAFTVNAAGGIVPQTITFTSTAPTDAAVDGVTYLATATATSGLPVTLSIDSESAAVCVINIGTVRFVGAGTCTVNANQGGDVFFAPAPQVQQSFTVGCAVMPAGELLLRNGFDNPGSCW